MAKELEYWIGNHLEHLSRPYLSWWHVWPKSSPSEWLKILLAIDMSVYSLAFVFLGPFWPFLHVFYCRLLSLLSKVSEINSDCKFFRPMVIDIQNYHSSLIHRCQRTIWQYYLHDMDTTRILFKMYMTWYDYGYCNDYFTLCKTVKSNETFKNFSQIFVNA